MVRASEASRWASVWGWGAARGARCGSFNGWVARGGQADSCCGCVVVGGVGGAVTHPDVRCLEGFRKIGGGRFLERVWN